MEDRQICERGQKQYSVKPGRDRIGTMFAKQEEFAKKFFDVKSMGPKEREEWLKEMCVADIAESVELMNETRWKHWKKNQPPMDIEQARFEVADKMAFLINMALLLGMDAEALFQYHSRKVEINAERQKANY
jgi:hypothetical protein